jgi:ornithine cyclodeaminase/alanine dehydrogenase-like protein (mu-crystallin family)
MCAVRPIKRVNVFSPTRVNRETFVKEIQQKVSAEVRAVDTPG